MRLALIVLALISAGVAVHVVVVACLNAVDQGRPVRWSPTALSRLLREWGVHMLAGATIPLGLKKLGADPALASSIWLTTFTDMFGFACLLGLGTLFVSHLQ